MAKWDWHATTWHDQNPVDLCRFIERHEPFALVTPDRPKHGYQTGVVFTSGGEAIARVWWGGNDGVHVILHNENAHRLAPLLRELEGHRELTRGDACEDFIEAGGFDRMADYWMRFAKARGLKINQQGDWVRGIARTLYIGSRQSPVMLRIYEKGHKEGGNPDWYRLEVEIKPKGRSVRMMAAGWDAGMAFNCSEWLVAGLRGIGWDHLQATAIGTVYRPTDEDRARLWIVKQGGGVITRWVVEAGSVEAFYTEFEAMAFELAMQ